MAGARFCLAAEKSPSPCSSFSGSAPVSRRSAFSSSLLIVELTVPDGWPIHITWAAMALAVTAYGAGRLSLDHLLERVEGLSR